MSDPVQKSSTKIVSHDPSVRKRKVPFRCGEDEYLHINEDGKKICLPQEPLGGFVSDTMTCNPCFSIGFMGIPDKPSKEKKDIPPPPPPPKDRFTPNAPKNLTELITGKAEYSCKTKMPYTEDWTVTRDISLPTIPEETEQAGRVRLEKAARDLTKTINGCFDVRFVRFLPTADEALKANQAKPVKTSSKEVSDPCAPGGELEHKPVCSK